MNLSSGSLRRPWSASCFFGEAFGRLTTGTTRRARNSNVISTTEGSTPSANSVLDVGRLCNPAEPIMVGSIPKWYKNQPSRHTAMETDVDLRPPISKFASDPNSRQSYSTGAGASYNSDLPEDFSKVKGFDICLPQSKGWSSRPIKRKIVCTTKENSKFEDFDLRSILRRRHRVLRPGMVLAKNVLPFGCEQVETLSACQTLGVGPGGFYQPVYKDGEELGMWMMSLGLNWNPENLTYEFIRSVDGCEVPPIPLKLVSIAHRVMYFAEEFIKMEFDTATYEGVIPSCFFNACVVSFCSAATGRLGLHQDCSERRENLSKGLPIVCISVGDSAEVLYGDEKDVDKAEKVLLESGDALIFGGESRHIYHGVSSIIPNTAPKELLEHTGLRPGRLNLSFREA